MAERPPGDDGPSTQQLVQEALRILEAMRREDMPAARVLGTDPPEVRARKLVSFFTELEARGELNGERARIILWDREPSRPRRDSQLSIKELLRAAAHLEPIDGEMPRETQKRILRLAWWIRVGREISRPPSGAPSSRLRRIAVELFRFKSPYVKTVQLLWEQERRPVKGLGKQREERQSLREKKKFLRTLQRAYLAVTGQSPPKVPGFLSRRFHKVSEGDRDPLEALTVGNFGTA